jgi:hypothetical protein
VVVSLVVLGLIYLVLPDRIAVLFWLTGDFVYAPREFVFVFALIPYVVYRTWWKKG